MHGTAQQQRRCRVSKGLLGSWRSRDGPDVHPGSSVALSIHLHIYARAAIFTRMTLQWGHGNDPPTGTKANKKTQRERSGLRFSRHEHKQTERGGRHALLSQPGQPQEQSPSLPSQLM